MKTSSYNGSRKAYLCPAIHMTAFAAEVRICENSTLLGGESETVTTETKRRGGIFDNGASDSPRGLGKYSDFSSL